MLGERAASSQDAAKPAGITSGKGLRALASLFKFSTRGWPWAKRGGAAPNQRHPPEPAPMMNVTAIYHLGRGKVETKVIRVPKNCPLGLVRLEAYSALEQIHGRPPEALDSVRIHFPNLHADISEGQELRAKLLLDSALRAKDQQSAMRKRDKDDLDEEQAVLDLYTEALGM